MTGNPAHHTTRTMTTRKKKSPARRQRRPHYSTPFCAIPGVSCNHEGCAAQEDTLGRLLRSLEEVREMAMPANLPCGADDAWAEMKEQRIAELEAAILLAQQTD